MLTRSHLLGISLGALALLGAGCGSDTECGGGTVLMDGACVPSDDACGPNATFNEDTGLCEGNACATGTTLVGDECVPDGTVVCGDGTTYDATSGTCVPDDSACAEGTVLVDGVCVPYDDSLTADVQEGPEGNGLGESDTPGQFTVPEIGADVTIMGCITPYEDLDDSGNLDPDFDAYLVAVQGPTLLNVTVDGLNGLSGGFIMLTGDPTLADHGWSRLGINVVDDVTSRQVFLPTAGVYALAITDGRSVLTAEGFGGPETCYYATVERLAIPSPTPFTGPTETGDLGDVQFYSYDVDEGDIIFPELAATSDAAVGALVVQVNNTYRFSADGDPAFAPVGGLSGSDTVVIAVDYFYDFSLSAVPYTLSIFDPGAQPLPTDGTAVTVPQDGFFYSWLYFDVDNAGDVLRLQLTVDGDAELWVFDPIALAPVGALCSTECASADEWVHFTRAGRYYVRTFDPDLTDVQTPIPTYDINSTVHEHTPTTLALGVAATGQAVSEDLVNWYRMDVESQDWLLFTGDPTAFAGSMEVLAYDGDSAGVIDTNLFDFDGWSVSTPTDEVGRIVRGSEITNVLLRVEDGGGATEDTAFSLEIDERLHTDLSVSESAPVSEVGETFGTDGTNYYLVAVPEAGTRLETVADSSNGCLTLSLLDYDESELDSDFDEGIAGFPMLTSVAGADLWAAYSVVDECSTTSYDFSINATEPITYTATAGTIAFVDVCEGGTNEIMTGADDELSSELTVDFAFTLFGDTATVYTVSSNGWVTFAPGYAGSTIHDTQFPDPGDPNFLVAPFSSDLDQISLCVKEEADKITFQWTGVIFFWDDPVQFQAVIHDDSSIDFIYGSAQYPEGYDGAIGIEDAFGVTGHQIGYYETGVANPGTSWTLTEDP